MPAGFDSNFACDLTRYLAVNTAAGLLIVAEWGIAIMLTLPPPNDRGAVLDRE
jgi:hypothetical protein